MGNLLKTFHTLLFASAVKTVVAFSPDLDLQLGRMRFCNEAKNRIMEHLVDQFSRQIISEYLISADFLFHCNLGAFLGEMKNSISLLVSFIKLGIVCRMADKAISRIRP